MLSSFAQTFYETKFRNDHNIECQGLMIYYSEDHCTFRVGFDYKDEWCVADCSYECESERIDRDIEVVIMAGELNKTFCDNYHGEGFIAPTFAWIYSDELGDEQYIPYAIYDLEADMDEWEQVISFDEIALSDMTQEFIEQYFSEDEREYKMMMRGIQQSHQNYHHNSHHNYRHDEEDDEDYNNDNYADNTEPSNNSQDQAQEDGQMYENMEATMHLICVCNTAIGDIGPSCETDKKNMQSNFSGIASRLGMAYKTYFVEGNNFCKKSVENVLSKLNASANDVIIFYYSGHGFRFDDQEDPYPMMSMAKTEYEDLENNYISVSDVYYYLQEKGARLNLVLTDCCNSKVGVNQVVTGNTLFSRSSNNYDIEKLATLFLKSKGNLISTGASPSQYSYCTQQGGYFTLNFLESLREQISVLNQNQPSWNTLISNTITKVEKQSHKDGDVQKGMKYVEISTLK